MLQYFVYLDLWLKRIIIPAPPAGVTTTLLPKACFAVSSTAPACDLDTISLCGSVSFRFNSEVFWRFVEWPYPTQPHAAIQKDKALLMMTAKETHINQHLFNFRNHANYFTVNEYLWLDSYICLEPFYLPLHSEFIFLKDIIPLSNFWLKCRCIIHISGPLPCSWLVSRCSFLGGRVPVDCCELQLTAVILCHFLPCQLEPFRPLHSINLHITCYSDCTTRMSHKGPC